MTNFFKDAANDVYIYADNAGPVTALTDVNFTLYVSKAGGVPASVSVIGLVTELDAANTPGWYKLALPSTVFDTEGQLLLHVSSGSFTTYTVQGDVGLISNLRDIRALAAQIGFSITSPIYDGNGNLTSARLNGFAPGDDPSVDTPIVQADITATYNANGTVATFIVEEV